MADSLIIAKLTLLLLRASVPNQNHFPSGVVISPDSEPLSETEALRRLTVTRSSTFTALIHGQNLVVRIAVPTEEELADMTSLTSIFGDVLRDQNREHNTSHDPNPLVEVRMDTESVLVPMALVNEWFALVHVPDVPMSISDPDKRSPPGSIGILQLGIEREWSQPR